MEKDHILSVPATWDTRERIYVDNLTDSAAFGRLRYCRAPVGE